MFSTFFTTFRIQSYKVYLNCWIIIMPKYAVAVGHVPGIYDSWEECKDQVTGCKGAKFKKFATAEEAQAYINEHGFNRKRTHDKVFKDVADSPNDYMEYDPFMHFMAESFNHQKVARLSPAEDPTFSLNSRLTALENKISSFMDKTSKTLENLTARILKLERTGEVVRKVPEQCSAESAIVIDKTESSETAKGLVTDAKGYVRVFTDGACSSNGKDGAKAGIGVWFDHNHPLNVSAPVKGPPTNNTAEIQAARVAITKAASVGVKHLAVNTDSKFVINCITKWIHRWKKNGWKLSNGGPVKNKDELIKLESAIQTVDSVEWVYVPGHKGTLGNEMADSLARAGAEKYVSNIRYADHVDGSVSDYGS